MLGMLTQEEGNMFSVWNGSESKPVAGLLQSPVEQVFKKPNLTYANTPGQLSPSM